MPTIGFLHTADQHVPTFRELREELAPAARDVHAVDPSLLADARAHGVTPDLIDRIDQHLDDLAAAGADVIVCTCSTIGGEAESRAARTGVPVLRGDRPMAEAAVAAGPRIAVVFSVRSTLAPTRDLLRESATRAGATITIVPAPCLAAWQAFEAGDLTRYAREVAAAARAAAAQSDVIVLAQASMASAAGLVGDLSIPVLTSPRTAVARAVKA